VLGRGRTAGGEPQLDWGLAEVAELLEGLAQLLDFVGEFMNVLIPR
jgi:hypothetical protein